MRTLTSKLQNAIWCQSDQLCFAYSFLTFGMLYNCCQDGNFFYEVYDEDMHNTLLILTLLKIINISMAIQIPSTFVYYIKNKQSH